MNEESLLNLVWAELLNEVDLVEALYKKEKNATHARLVVRTLFSAIEALCSVAANAAWLPLESRVAAEVAENRVSFSAEKDVFALTALRFKIFNIDDAGEIKQEKPKVHFHRQLLFTIKTLSRVNGVTFNPKQEDGWESLLVGTKVRDRIMHPKDGVELFVSDDEVQHAGKALHWFLACLRKAKGLPPKKFSSPFEE